MPSFRPLLRSLAIRSVVFLTLLAPLAHAQDNPHTGDGAPSGDVPGAPIEAPAATRSGAASGEGILALLPGPSRSEHTIRTEDGVLAYNAEAATLSLLGGDGKVTAEMFYVAYALDREADGTQDSADAAPDRPITFVFNGGPGAASAYLHLGALGPRALVTEESGAFLPAPSRLEDNPDTWLGFTDLVFVDPVGTGYSRAAPGEDEKRFFGVDGDASSVGAFIRLYLQKTGRTDAPVYLAGESYGGFRAALLAKTLQEDVGITPSGIVLVSPALEFSLLRGEDFLPLKWALTLPAMAAVRFEADGLSGDTLAARLAEVEDYALSDYMTALASGVESGRDAASQRVSDLLGLPIDLVRRHFARVPTSVFAREFERDRGRVLSLYDGAIGTADIAPESAWSETPDPLLDRSVPILTQAFVTYVREELGFRSDISYRLLNRDINQAWDFGTSPSRQGYAGVMDDLQEARSLNPSLGVLIAHGYGDLVTPYLASRYLVSQLPTLEGARPIETTVYPGGHMMYFRSESRRALARDATRLYGK
ncbi:MAG: peptidase S10 [Rhizobiaceae bacterium]|nr:peptidase S10 [Rhizobiaceae bacterium]